MASCILLAAVAGSIHAGDFNVVRIAANNWAFCRKTELNNAGRVRTPNDAVASVH